MIAPYRFGGFELQPDQRRLLADGRPLPLGQRAFDVLHALIERRERLVTKNELLDVVWPGVVVEENNLQVVQISSLRKLLGPQAIATIPGRGYRFALPLDGGAQASANAPSAVRIPAAAQSPAPAMPRSNLPDALPRLFGRDEDLSALRALIDTRRLVTVVGAGVLPGVTTLRRRDRRKHRSDGAKMSQADQRGGRVDAAGAASVPWAAPVASTVAVGGAADSSGWKSRKLKP